MNHGSSYSGLLVGPGPKLEMPSYSSAGIISRGDLNFCVRGSPLLQLKPKEKGVVFLWQETCVSSSDQSVVTELSGLRVGSVRPFIGQFPEVG